MPCFKLGIKMNAPNFVKDFLLAQLSGFYFSVEREGEIEAGNAIELITKTDGLTIEEAFRAYHAERDNKLLLEKAINTPDLPNDWKVFFKKRYDAL